MLMSLSKSLMKQIRNYNIDIHDFLDEAKAHASIHHFENTWHNQTDQYSAQPMLKNNLRDNQEPK